MSGTNTTVFLDQQAAIDVTNCSELNDQLLLCYDKTRDWRQCKKELQAFKECYEKYERSGKSTRQKLFTGLHAIMLSACIDIDAVRQRAYRELFVNEWSTGKVPVKLFDDNTPIMAAEFANHGSSLLVANENGYVRNINLDEEGQLKLSCEAKYSDAVFDVSWNADDSIFAVGLGNADLSLHDSSIGSHLKTLKFHDSSIRTVKFKPTEANSFASAGRDGHIAIWDLRAGDAPINIIHDAHCHRSVPPKSAKKNGSHQSHHPNSSVTSFIFIPSQDHLIASVGQPDYAIRTWDLRYSWRRGSTPTPVHEISPPISGRRERAFISLCCSSDGSYLYAVSSDNNIYTYLTNGTTAPVDVLNAPGFRTSGSFYTRCSMSPDDQYLLCGATEGSAFVWPTDSRRRTNAFSLSEHRYEVSCVAWSKTPSRQYIFVGGEDCFSRIWYRHAEEKVVDLTLYERPSLINVPQQSSSSLTRQSHQRPDLKSDNMGSLPTWPSRDPPRSPSTVVTPQRTPFAKLLKNVQTSLQISSITSSSPCSITKRKRQTALDDFISK